MGAANTTADGTATLLGQAVFGDMDQLACSTFAGSAAQADAWIGNPPGTTAYDPGPAVAISGALIGTTPAAVAAAQFALAAMAGLQPGPAVLPTGVSWRGWDPWASCRFGPTDLVFDAGGIVRAGSTGPYQLPYRLLLRRGAPPGGAIGMWTPSRTGLLAPVPDGGDWRPINGPTPWADPDYVA